MVGRGTCPLSRLLQGWSARAGIRRVGLMPNKNARHRINLRRAFVTYYRCDQLDALVRPCSRSAMISVTSSVPMDRRTTFGAAPAAVCCSAVN
jgi:hypothetical protein